MAIKIATGLKRKVNMRSHHRTGFCEVCGTKLELDPKAYWSEDAEAYVIDMVFDGLMGTRYKKALNNWCPNCKGGSYQKGRLVCTFMTITKPERPEIPWPRELAKYTLAYLRWDALSEYHRRRCEFAEANRNRDIPLKYRTGEPQPVGVLNCFREMRELIKCARSLEEDGTDRNLDQRGNRRSN